jgi:hypothetical protein
MYLADRLHFDLITTNMLPWSRRKRLINDHHELELYRMRKQEEAAKRARSRRR